MGPSTVNAKMGKAPFAAFLKNSLRDWSSSFFFDFFITLEVFMLPSNSLIRRNTNNFNFGNKKDVGVISPRLSL